MPRDNSDLPESWSQHAAYLCGLPPRPGGLPCCSGSADAAVQHPPVGHMRAPILDGPPARVPAVEARHSLFDRPTIRRIGCPALCPDRRLGTAAAAACPREPEPRASRPPPAHGRSSIGSSPSRHHATFQTESPPHQSLHGSERCGLITVAPNSDQDSAIESDSNSN